MKPRRPSGGTLGVSLLEVLMAMALVTMVVLGMAGFGAVAIKGSAFSQKMTKAVTLAQDALEEVRREGYRPTLSEELNQTEPYGSIPGEPYFERTVITQPHSPSPGLQSITVTVSWESNRHSTSLATMLAE